MGTSTARKPPSGPLWRAAARAAGRYLAPAAETPSAREVIRRYVVAAGSGEGEGGPPGPFRLARRVAQELGAFLEERGGILATDSGTPLAALARAHALAETWVPEDGSLVCAACRSALVTVLVRHLAARGAPPAPVAKVVREFLMAAVAVQLYLDLGEVLEAAAPSSDRLDEGWEGLAQALREALPEPDPPPAHSWRQLPGWLWITRVLRGLEAI